MGFFCKAGAARRGLLPTRCHWNCLKYLEQTTPNPPDFGLPYKHQTWSRFCSGTGALRGNPDWGMLIVPSSWFDMDLGRRKVKFMKFGNVLGDLLLEEIHLETRKGMPGLNHSLAEGSSKAEQGPAKTPVWHLLLSQQCPGLGQPHRGEQVTLGCHLSHH